MAFLVAELTLGSLHRPPSWDEAVYLSQVRLGIPAVVFAPSRARGIVLLVAPVGWSSSIVAVRVSLAVASAALLIVVFAAWSRLVGAGAAVAAAVVFGGSWLAVFYGAEVMPNLWVALLALLAAALAIRAIEDRRPRTLVLASASVAAAALFRPIDAAAAAVLLIAYTLLRRAPLRVPAALIAGLAAGVLPWLVEMSIRFGGPLHAVRDAASVGHVHAGHPAWAFVQQLALTDGPTLGPERHPNVPALGVVWWAGLVVLVATALVSARRTPRFHVLAVASLIGASFGVLYLGFVAGLAPRFLLPAYAFLAIPAGAGLASLRRPSLRVVAIVGLAAWLAMQLATTHRIADGAGKDRIRFQGIGAELARLAGGRPCSFAGVGGFPQIQLASGCPGGELTGPPSDAGTRFVVTPSSIVAGGPYGRRETVAGWTIWERR